MKYKLLKMEEIIKTYLVDILVLILVIVFAFEKLFNCYVVIPLFFLILLIILFMLCIKKIKKIYYIYCFLLLIILLDTLPKFRIIKINSNNLRVQILPIVYGKPTKETIEKARKGKIILGGCLVRPYRYAIAIKKSKKSN